MIGAAVGSCAINDQAIFICGDLLIILIAEVPVAALPWAGA